MPYPPRLARAAAALTAFCKTFPEAYEDHPWGETVYKVKGKVFVFLGVPDDTFGISAKLPITGAVALMLPFASPTGYNLGKAGWVSARFTAKDDIPLDLLKAWIDESYRAVAPKKLAAQLPSEPDSAPAPAKPPPLKKTAKPPSPAKKTAPKKSAARKRA
ncbi:MAG: MmcQ/YjbR family DNA-binding protein [Polyangiaceae bacterium]